MSKRFVDTTLFDDAWFMDLSTEAKVLWMYFITKCDHAGTLKLNEKLCLVQTGIKDLKASFKELGNSLVRVREDLYFIPKFVEYQYPGFPNSNVRQQKSALEILEKYGLIKDNKLRLTKELPNSYDNDKKRLEEISGFARTRKATPPEPEGKATRTERNKKYFPLVEKLSKIIQSNKNIKHTPQQLLSWCDYFRQVEENDEISIERMEEALTWYEKHIGEDYVVEIEGGKSWREKFVRLETASKKKPIQNSNLEKFKYDDGVKYVLGKDGRYYHCRTKELYIP